MDARDQIFVTSYLTDFNAARAARAAGHGGRHTSSVGYHMLRRPEIRAAIDEALAARLARVKAGLEKVEASENFVLQQWLDIAMADANEIVQHRRTCCRYCHGVDGKYQRTRAEYEADYRSHQADPARALAAEFDPQGGDGFNATLDPNPECFECFGEGQSGVHLADTRDLSPGARALYAGVKQTKDGIEVKFNSKDKALEMIARHLGMLKDRVEVEGTLGLVERLARGRKRVASPDDGSDLAG